MVEVLNNCPICNSAYSMIVPFEGYFAWQTGKLIQDALPNLSATERECLISGICPKCQNKIFGEE